MMPASRLMIFAGFLALAACDQPQGVGLGPLGEPGPARLPQSTSAEYQLGGVEAPPIHRFNVAAENDDPAYAATVGGSELRKRDANLILDIKGTTYGMRQVELNSSNYAIVEGGPATADLPVILKTRTGCLVDSEPLRSGDAVVYTLDCS